jgi:excinuclease UvrABC ATPase subunit
MNRKMNGRQIEGIYDDIKGLEYIDKVIGIDQKPIGRLQGPILQHIQVFLHTLGIFLLKHKKQEQEDINREI